MRLFGGKPVIGSVGEAGFTLRKRIAYRNSFQTLLKADVLSDGAGARLSCRVGMALATMLFVIVWMGLVVVIGGGVVLALLSGGAGEVPVWSFAIVPYLLLFGAGMLVVGRWLARHEGRFLLDFLCRELDARPDERPTHQAQPIVR